MVQLCHFKARHSLHIGGHAGSDIEKVCPEHQSSWAVEPNGNNWGSPLPPANWRDWSVEPSTGHWEDSSPQACLKIQVAELSRDGKKSPLPLECPGIQAADTQGEHPSSDMTENTEHQQ